MPVTSVRRRRASRPKPRASGEEYSRFMLRYTSAPSQETRARVELMRVRKELRQFLRTQTPRVVLVAAIGFAIGWIMNFQFMRKKYDGFNVPEFAPFTGKGSRIVGMLFWFVLSTVLFAFVGMLRKRGRAALKDQIVGTPATPTSPTEDASTGSPDTAVPSGGPLSTAGRPRTVVAVPTATPGTPRRTPRGTLTPPFLPNTGLRAVGSWSPASPCSSSAGSRWRPGTPRPERADGTSPPGGEPARGAARA